MSWQDSYAEVNPPVVNEGYQGPPRIWWRNGSRQAGTAGFFYTKALEHPDELGAPWTSSDRYANEAGYETPDLAFAIVGWRSEPFETIEVNGQTRRRFLPEYQPGAKIYTEYLVLVDGLSYPCVLCAQGLTGKAMAAAVKEFRAQVLTPATRLRKKPVASWSFWMQMTGETDRRGKPVYTDTGYKSFITRPVLILPNMEEEDLLEHLYVGKDVVVQGVDVRAEYTNWLKERRADKQPAPAAQAGADDGHAEVDPTDYSYVDLDDQEVPL